MKEKITKVFREFIEGARNFHLQIVAISLIIATILIVYWQDLSILFNEALQSEAVSHIVLVPFFVSYLIYRKREFVKASLELERLRGKAKLVSVSDIVGAAFCLTAFLLYWYGSYTFYPLEYHVASLLLFIMGITLILVNAKTLVILIFPITFLVFLMPPPSTIIYTAGGLLANVNTQGSYTLLKIAGLPVSLSYNYGAPIIALNTSTGPIEFAVYQASSGLYSLIAFTMFATFLIYIARGSFTKKGALFVLGLLILPIINIIRISLIVSIAYWLGEEIAMNIFHTFTGWLLIFGGILLLLLIGEKILHLQILGGSKTSSCTECKSSLKKQESFCLSCGKFLKPRHVRISKVFWVKVMALLIGSYLVTVSIQAPAFAFAPGLTVSNSNPQVNTNMFPEITDYQLQFLYRDVSYERVAGQDVSLVYAYSPTPNGSALPVYVIVGVATSIANLHNWEASLIAWQIERGLPPLVSLIDSGDLQLTENPRIIAHYLAFQHPSNYTYVALYWYQRALFKTELTVEARYVRINLLILTKNPNDSSKLVKELQSLGKLIAAYWEPLRVQSLFSLGIPIQQFLLCSAVLAAVFVQTSQYALEQRKKKTNLTIFEKFAPPNEKLLYQTIKELRQETKETTTKNIASRLEKATGKAMKPNKLTDLLNNLEKHGLIKADIINIMDQPTLVWKN